MQNLLNYWTTQKQTADQLYPDDRGLHSPDMSQLDGAAGVGIKVFKADFVKYKSLI